MKGWGLIVALGLLAACGGGGEAPSSSGGIGSGGGSVPKEDDLTPVMQLFTTVPGQPLNQPPKTDYWLYARSVDWTTLDVINEKGRYFNPSNFGAYSLPSGKGDFTERRSHFDADCNQQGPLTDLQKLALRRMQETAKPIGQGSVWLYDFDALGADYIIKAPYPSSYAQAININGLLFGYCKTRDAAYLELARKAGLAMLLPIQKGGGTNTFDGFTWYEELVGPSGFNPYIFNGHAYSVLALYMLGEATGDAAFTQAAQKGVESLNQLLPLFETGDWTKYDLRPPSPNIYVELHASNPGGVRKINVSANGESYTLCAIGCTQRIDTASAGNAFRFNANLPSLRAYHGGNASIALSVEISGSVDTEWRSLSMRPVGGESMFPQPDRTITLNEMGWGQTPAAYQLWHAFLMEELYSWTDNPLHAETAARWRTQLADFQAAQ